MESEDSLPHLKDHVLVSILGRANLTGTLNTVSSLDSF
jgi:hypothetical protein